MDAVGFAHGLSSKKADDLAPTISAVFELPTTPQVLVSGFSGSQNSEEGDGEVQNSGKGSGAGQPGDSLANYRVEDESPDTSDDDGELVMTKRSRTTMNSPFLVMMTFSSVNVWTVILYMF